MTAGVDSFARARARCAHMRKSLWLAVLGFSSLLSAEAYVGKSKWKLRADPLAFELVFDWAAAETLHDFLKAPTTGTDAQCVSRKACRFAAGEALDGPPEDGFVSVARLDDQTARLVVKGTFGRRLMEAPATAPFRCEKKLARAGKGLRFALQSRCEACFDSDGALKQCP
jgi:hypothetical protein